jgi:hypothetical protein
MGLNQNQRKALRRKQAAELKVAELSNTVASDAPDSSTDQHSQCELSVLQPETAFAPDTLDPAFVAKQHALGEGELVEKIRHKWDEIKAVKDRYPVSRGMLERLAHETMQTILLPSTATRDKLIATKLLLTMAAGNHANKGLPAQVEVNVNNNTFDMRRIIDAVLNDDAMGIHDTRETKIIPGSPNDYAE